MGAGVLVIAPWVSRSARAARRRKALNGEKAPAVRRSSAMRESFRFMSIFRRHGYFSLIVAAVYVMLGLVLRKKAPLWLRTVNAKTKASQ